MPVIAKAVIVSGALPELARVMVCALLLVLTGCDPKPRLAGEKETAGAVATPPPLRASVCGLPLALSATLTVAVRVPAAVGAKLTVIVHVALAASVTGASGQLLDST